MKSAPLLVALLALGCSKSTSSSSAAVTGGIGPAGGGTAQAGADATAGGNGAGAAGDGISGAVGGSAGASAMAPDDYDDSGCEHPAVAKDCKDGWCKVPPGCFIMGSPEQEWGHPPQEKRVKVTLTRGFVIGQHEVTNEQWASFKLTNPGRVIDSGPGDMTSRGEVGVCVEEPALNDIAWYCFNAGKLTKRVGQLAPNAWGLFDVLGNAEEWSHDQSGWVPSAETLTDPDQTFGPGQARDTRGGAPFAWPGVCRVASRGSASAGFASPATGFRLVRTLPSLEK